MFSRPTVVACVFASSTLLAPFARAGILRVPSDHPTIQSAIDAAGDGDVIEISKGTYFETLTIDGKDGLTLRAKKGHKVVVDGAGAMPLLHVTQGTFGTLVEGLRLRNSGSDGVVVEGGFTTIRSCRIEDCAGDGLVFTAQQGLGKAIQNRIRDVGGVGILAVGQDLELRGNLVETKEPLTGAIVLGDDDNETTGVVLENEVDSVLTGILLNASADGVLVSGNRVFGGVFGIFVSNDSKGHTILANTLTGVGTGVWIGEDDQSVFQNVVKKPLANGIEFSNAVDVVARHNVVKKAGVDGFHLSASGFCTLEFNKAKKSASFDLFDDTGANVYFHNKFKTIGP